jgi:hypothetical protein
MKKTEYKALTPKKQKQVVQMVSYSIKMTIPTAAYANIIPEIVVKGGTIEEAHNFVAPHMNRLWKEYYMISERRQELTKAPIVTKMPSEPVVPKTIVATPANTTTTIPNATQVVIETLGGKVMGDKLPEDVGPEVPPPDSGVALIKATQAIESCLSLDALELIEKQVIKSVKLSKEDKESLMPLLHNKSIELFGDDNE